ncbi:hypothetical protein UFOVP3_50 [uncultured Caudovirales phage]|uniref:Uncharacterized protein n=1 Tax=uncultured Caudovirales phage TaxID=2100421 RepID=A0A6J5T741_9CAUD|nr:hypothetical protein UFOVP3_50 [uncultured Caudovirales phage]
MNELLDLQLDEVSLVDSPANKSATVALFKRDMNMAKAKKEDVEKGVCIEIEIKTPEEEMAEMQMEAQQDQAEDVAAVGKSEELTEVETLKAEVERLSKALEEAVQEEVAKAEEMIDFAGEMVAKSAIPEPVLKKLEEVQKAQEAQDLRKRAEEELPNFAGTADQRGKLLKSIGNDADLMSLLKSADAAFAGLFQEVGKTDVDAGLLSADQKLDELVKNRQADKKEDFYKAYAAVIKTAEGKDLLLQTYKK